MSYGHIFSSDDYGSLLTLVVVCGAEGLVVYYIIL